jgi:flagellar motor switch protein FliG
LILSHIQIFSSFPSIPQEEHSRIVQNFKDLIREQDRQLDELRRKNEEMEKKLQQTTQELNLYKTRTVSSITAQSFINICSLLMNDSFFVLLEWSWNESRFGKIFKTRTRSNYKTA